ncbi:MAG: hypothetical protein QOH57_1030 [Mycobacterium sp.]|jgi:uncharacterized protein YciI|nr:hypothetical protein [Mycobacterium sp.]
MFHVLKSTYLKAPEIVDETRPSHLAWLEEEVTAGRLVLAGRQDDGSGGVLITADMEVNAVDDLLKTDPYVKAGVASYERTSFNAAARAPGL